MPHITDSVITVLRHYYDETELSRFYVPWSVRSATGISVVYIKASWKFITNNCFNSGVTGHWINLVKTYLNRGTTKLMCYAEIRPKTKYFNAQRRVMRETKAVLPSCDNQPFFGVRTVACFRVLIDLFSHFWKHFRIDWWQPINGHPWTRIIWLFHHMCLRMSFFRIARYKWNTS